MTKTKCTGCKIFSLCLGDVESFLESGMVNRCNHCDAHQAGQTYLSKKDVCEEFRVESLRRILDGFDTYLTCSECLRIEERHTKSQEIYKPAGRVGYVTPWMQGR